MFVQETGKYEDVTLSSDSFTGDFGKNLIFVQ